MQPPHLDPKGSACPQRQPRKQSCHVVFVQPVQGAPQTVVVEVLGQDPWPQKVFHRFVSVELRHQIEPPIAEAQAIEHHRYRGRPDADQLAVARFLLVQPVRHADLATNLGDEAQMVEMFDHIA